MMMMGGTPDGGAGEQNGAEPPRVHVAPRWASPGSGQRPRATFVTPERSGTVVRRLEEPVAGLQPASERGAALRAPPMVGQPRSPAHAAPQGLQRASEGGALSALDPYASAHVRAEAYGAMQVARFSGESVRTRTRPTYTEWMAAPALHDYFWLCPRCHVANKNDEVHCSRCFDTRDAILGKPPTAELAALEANTQRISYGRGVVRAVPAASVGDRTRTTVMRSHACSERRRSGGPAGERTRDRLSRCRTGVSARSPAHARRGGTSGDRRAGL